MMLRKIVTASLVAVALAGTTLAASDPAEARYRRHGAFLGGVALGVLGGALLTGGYGYGYPGYGYGYPAYGYGYPGYGYGYPAYGYGYPSYGYAYPSYGYAYPSYSYRRYVYSYPRYGYRHRRYLYGSPSNDYFRHPAINGQTDRN